jgi:diguanylate cyclase (GGDEF)-like protein
MMPQFLISEPAEAILSTLGEALDLVDFGIVLLNRDLRVRFINRRYAEMWQLPDALLATGPEFRDLMEYAGGNSWYDVPEADLPAFLDQREAAVRAGSISATPIDLRDGRRVLFRCVACPDGGRILTFDDISPAKRELDLQREAQNAAERMGAELRFSNETLESQAAYLASMAEAAEENARKANAARQQLEHEIAERRKLEAQLREMATTDALTGALNRVQLMNLGQRELERARRIGQGLAVLMLDIDHFKAINDRYGHPVGDLALQHVVGTLRSRLRRIDLLGRLGGEEFAILLPAIPLEGAEHVAERLRAGVAETPLERGEDRIGMTVSIGLAFGHQTDRGFEQLIARADAALYRAKGGGRNRVEKDQQAIAA